MNIFKNIKNHLVNGLKKNLSLAIISLITAIIAWLVISLTIYPSIPKTIYDIPIDTDISGTAAAENGLSLISCDVEKVTVKLLGNRAQVGNLNSENLKARIIADNISTTGSKKLKIEIVNVDSDVEFEVESIYPETATVVFDKYETRSFSVQPEIPNITFAEGKTKNDDEFHCDPEVINITGPSAQLDKISKCVAISNKELELDTTYTLPSDEIKLYTEDGATIEQSQFKFDTTSYQIYIPVLSQKTVGLSVGIVGAPSNFDKDSLKFNFSADSITIASKTNQLDNDISDTFEVGKILLSDLKPGYSKTFNIELNDYINMSNLDTVTVTLDDSDLITKELVINHFEISNAPSNYDFSVLTQKLDIVVVGPADTIDSITSKDIVADINLLNVTTIQSDSFNYDVTLSCPTNDKVWVATQSKVILSKKEKVKTTPSDSPNIDDDE